MKANHAPAIHIVLRRQRDLGFIAQIKSHRSPHHDAYQALAKPLDQQSFVRRLLAPDRPRRVRNLLRIIRGEHPTAAANLSAATVAYWDNYLARPRYWRWGWWALLTTPVAVALFFLFRAMVRPEQVSLLAVLSIPPAIAAGAAIHLFVFVWPRWLWRRRLQRSPPIPLWIRAGWAPSIPILLLASLLIPPSPTATTAIIVMSTVTAYWAFLVGERDHRDVTYGWAAHPVITEAPLVIWWIVIWAGWADLAWMFRYGQCYQMTAAALAGAVASMCGSMTLYRPWVVKLRPQVRLIALATLGVLCIGTAVLLWRADHEISEQPSAAIAITLLVLLRRVPGLTIAPSRDRFRILYLLGIFSVAGWQMGRDMIVPGGFWLLSSSILTVMSAFRGARQLVKAKRHF